MTARPPEELAHCGLPAADVATAGVTAARAEWVLFTDWCAVTGHVSRPATAETVLMFFGDCPAAPATLARRLTAIDAAHRAAGVTQPERTGQVRDVVRGRPAQPARLELDPALVAAALRRLPSHGWINGWFGRRDRVLLVVAQAGVPYRGIAALTAGDITLTDTVATISFPTVPITLHPGDDPVLCGPCALVRWLRALHLALTKPSTRSLAWAIDRAPTVDGSSPHVCRSRRPLPAGIAEVPLLPPIDPRGYVSMTPRPLSPHSVSHLARGNTLGPGTIHRVEPQTLDEPAPPPAVTPMPPAATPYTAQDWEQAVARRRADQERLRGIDRTLDETDRRAAELNRRLVALLADQ
jgi:hypothetical protein